MTKLSLGKRVFSISFDVYNYYAAKQSLAFHLRIYFWMLKQADPILCSAFLADVTILMLEFYGYAGVFFSHIIIKSPLIFINSLLNDAHTMTV